MFPSCILSPAQIFTVSVNSKIGSTNNVVLTILSQPDKEANVSVYNPVTK